YRICDTSFANLHAFRSLHAKHRFSYELAFANSIERVPRVVPISFEVDAHRKCTGRHQRSEIPEFASATVRSKILEDEVPEQTHRAPAKKLETVERRRITNG